MSEPIVPLDMQRVVAGIGTVLGAAIFLTVYLIALLRDMRLLDHPSADLPRSPMGDSR
jgi:hypothetical protein